QANWLSSLSLLIDICARCRAVGVQFDSGRDVMYQNHPSNVICLLQHQDGHWIIDADDNDRPTLSSFATALRRAYKASREDRRPITASHVEAHELFAHASKEAIDHLNENVRGIALESDARAPRLQECDTCIEAKSTAQTLHSIMPALRGLINKIQRQYGHVVVVLKIDGERGYGLELYEIAKQAGFKIELRAPDTAEQLGSAEKAGHEDIEILDIPHPQETEADLSALIEPLQTRLHIIDENSAQAMQTIKEGVEKKHLKDLDYLPTPEPSIRGNTISPYQEEGEDNQHRDAEDQDLEQQLQEQLLNEMQSNQEDDSSTIHVRVPQQESATTRQGPLTPAALERRNQPQKAQSTLPKGWVNSDDYVPDRQKNNAPRMADPKVGSSSNIVTGKRARKPPNQALAT
ncbi:hypothetical protein PtrCC142_011471, partial [Pyrenophora tritici-repentis]